MALAEEQTTELCALWRRAGAQSLHAAGCSCCNGGRAVVIEPAALREDIEFALRARYRREDRPDLLEHLDAASDPLFADWVSNLASNTAAAAILADIKTTLLSMVSISGGSR